MHSNQYKLTLTTNKIIVALDSFTNDLTSTLTFHISMMVSFTQ